MVSASLWLALLALSGRRSGSSDGCDGAAAMAFSPTPIALHRARAAATRYNRGGGYKRISTFGSNEDGGVSDTSNVAGSTENRCYETPMIIGDESDDGIATKGSEKRAADAFEGVVNARYACTRFRRHQEPEEGSQSSQSPKVATASLSSDSAVEAARRCAALAHRAPTGFNAQPYRIVLVHTREGKERLARYCLGRNADRVRDSDCTAVFLADRECGRDGRRFVRFLVDNMDDNGRTSGRTRRTMSSRALLKLRGLILLFSSGYPLPRMVSVPISFGVRLGVSALSLVMRLLHSLKQMPSLRFVTSILPENIQLLPTLSSSDTWSQKNTMLVAATYLLACTSCGLATCPMEGFDACGVRRVLGVPGGRFGVPLIVSAGEPYHRREGDGGVEEEETDDVGLSHGTSVMSPRFPFDEVVYSDKFGVPFAST